MNEYVRVFSNVAAIHASCEDFRAAADIDLEMDNADDEAGKKIECPLHVLWGAKGTVGSLWDVLAVWREKCAASVTGKSLDCKGGVASPPRAGLSSSPFDAPPAGETITELPLSDGGVGLVLGGGPPRRLQGIRLPRAARSASADG